MQILFKDTKEYIEKNKYDELFTMCFNDIVLPVGRSVMIYQLYKKLLDDVVGIMEDRSLLIESFEKAIVNIEEGLRKEYGINITLPHSSYVPERIVKDINRETQTDIPTDTQAIDNEPVDFEALFKKLMGREEKEGEHNE